MKDGAETVFVNDRPRPLAPGATVQALVAELGLGGRKGLAVALNGAVVPRQAWPSRALAPADRLVIIQATQGG